MYVYIDVIHLLAEVYFDKQYLRCGILSSQQLGNIVKQAVVNYLQFQRKYCVFVTPGQGGY